MPDVELERFKSQINLSEFAASRGYALDRRESSRNSAVMRHPDADKIIIAQNENSAIGCISASGMIETTEQ